MQGVILSLFRKVW